MQPFEEKQKIYAKDKNMHLLSHILLSLSQKKKKKILNIVDGTTIFLNINQKILGNLFENFYRIFLCDSSEKRLNTFFLK